MTSIVVVVADDEMMMAVVVVIRWLNHFLKLLKEKLSLSSCSRLCPPPLFLWYRYEKSNTTKDKSTNQLKSLGDQSFVANVTTVVMKGVEVDDTADSTTAAVGVEVNTEEENNEMLGR